MKETDRQRQTGKRDIQRQIYVDTETDRHRDREYRETDRQRQTDIQLRDI